MGEVGNLGVRDFELGRAVERLCETAESGPTDDTDTRAGESGGKLCPDVVCGLGCEGDCSGGSDFGHCDRGAGTFGFDGGEDADEYN
jgi:hypothetical protein